MEAQAQGIVDNFRDLLCELGVGIEISGQNPKAPGNWREGRGFLEMDFVLRER